jgi:tripartite-type tricarboxylate transporter receptor subunit TctC
VPLAIGTVFLVAPHVKSGKLRALAVTSATPDPQLPGAQPIAAQGVPGFEAVLRYGFVAPPGTPRAIIERLNAALNAALASDDVRKRLAIDGAEPLPGTPADYASDIDREETQWSKVVKASGAKAE